MSENRIRKGPNVPSYGPASAGIRVDGTSLELKVNPDGTERVFSGDYQYVITETVLAASVDNTIFTANEDYQVTGVVYTPTIAGTGGAATFVVRKCTGTQLPSAGTAVHSGTANMVGTINTPQTLTLSTTTSELQLTSGDRLAVDFTGTMTSVVGRLTVFLKKI
jgi:hypothetical protein